MEITPETANGIVATLASVTAADITRGASILPLDLDAAVFVLDASIEYVANTETSHIYFYVITALLKWILKYFKMNL